ncbi:unnamed protein product [Rhizoctonia solani]|uniref:CHAT domain-containing protein n=1 Tax=Rhizoctonia solani TaxID=456999 RepID=A0A8H2XKG9_9AGAM|nr:unnamed protein product [Rhizoctonia solani]
MHSSSPQTGRSQDRIPQSLNDYRNSHADSNDSDLHQSSDLESDEDLNDSDTEMETGIPGLFSLGPGSGATGRGQHSPFMSFGTGRESMRFSKPNSSAAMTHRGFVEKELHDLRYRMSSNTSSEDTDKPLMKRVQELDARVSDLEAQIKASESPDYSNVKSEVQAILKDMTDLLQEISPKRPTQAKKPPPRAPQGSMLAFDKLLSMLAMLASSLMAQSRDQNFAQYLVLTRSCLRAACKYAPVDHIILPTIFLHEGTLYFHRFHFFGGKKDISNALDSFQTALKKTRQSGGSIEAISYGWLGRTHLARFEEFKYEKDLERAMNCHDRAVKLLESKPGKASSEEKTLISEGRGLALQCLVEHIGELNSKILIDSEIDRWRGMVLRLFRKKGQEVARAGHMLVLGCLYSTRFKQHNFQHSGDSENSLKLLAMAVAGLPKNDARFRPALCALATALIAKYSSSRDSCEADVELAFKFLDLAKRLTPDGDRFTPQLLNNLGDICMTLSNKGADEHYLRRAMSYYNEVIALNSVPMGSRLWAKIRQNLGLCWVYEYNAWKPHNLVKANRYLGQAVIEFHDIAWAGDHPFDRFTAACNWAKYAALHSELRVALEGYDTAMELLPLVACFGAVPEQRHIATQQAGRLSVEAAALAIKSKEYGTALRWLEQGRAIKWSHIFRLQTPLRKLRSSLPNGPRLANKLETLCKGLHLEEGLHPEEGTQSSETKEQTYQKDLYLHTQYENVLADIRSLTDFEDFMMPKDASELVQAARDGPIVVINVHQGRCDALVVRAPESDEEDGDGEETGEEKGAEQEEGEPDEELKQGPKPEDVNDRIQHIHLPQLTYRKTKKVQEKIEKSLADLRADKQGVAPDPMTELKTQLKNLWDWVVKPILTALKYTRRSPKDPISNLPHITWCGTGPLTFLPLHAAGDYSKPGYKTFEYVISSYTPTLGTLLSTSDSSEKPQAPRILLTAEDWEYPQCKRIEGSKATPKAVLAAMQDHNWIHLACHSEQNSGDPAKCGFDLNGELLSLDEIAKMDYKSRGLAFLSSCGTATGDQDLPDEAIHLASGMLMAGYSSVIATMWPVRDEEARTVSKHVYGKLLGAEAAYTESAAALHSALGELRKKKVSLDDWLPFVHFGV